MNLHDRVPSVRPFAQRAVSSTLMAGLVCGTADVARVNAQEELFMPQPQKTTSAMAQERAALPFAIATH